ncbi:MAG: terminase large subunit [Desulfovibrio sp.]|nr:terminase large subunit [Desulfovibrio sp.]
MESATAYANGILSGAIDACEYVKLACKRHLDDLKKQDDPDYPYYFDPAKAERVCCFVEMMIFTSGKWQRQKIQLQPWQLFITATVFGWMKRSNKKRRFREAYIECPRKQGKSEYSAALGHYMLTADGELGAEVYCGASTEKQAWEAFSAARKMALWNEEYLSAFGLTVGAKNISLLSNGSKFEPLIGDPGDGGKPSFAIIDEFHEHTTPNLYDTMKTGTASREQPLTWIITTAGSNSSGPCYAKHEEAIKVLQGGLDNPELFAVIYTIDTKDDWKDFSVWKKANPNFGVSALEDDLRGKYRDAMQLAHRQNINKCKHLDIWSNAAVGFINMAKWDECARPEIKFEDFAGQLCWVGIDLASKIDLTAMMFLFRTMEQNDFAEFLPGNYTLFGKFYLPEDTVNLPENKYYQAWAAEGLLTVTPGARTDYAYLEQDLRAAAEMFRIRELTYDPREAEYLMQEIRLWADFPCIEVNQSPLYISEPMKEFEALYLSGKLLHDGNSLLRWQASNVIRKDLRNKAFYPSKSRNENKIDGIVAAIMALSRAMVHDNSSSVYETRGFIQL